MPETKTELKDFRAALAAWYRREHRKLPWRETRDPYRIWLSEIMLQQTRVATALPYYERFLARFPTVEVLAEAPEQEVLTAWSGLGYYWRVRNMQKAAQEISARGGFPRDYPGIRALAGVGDYTAAAVASVAFGLPRAVLDGNVMRVVSRLSNDAGDIRSSVTRRRFQAEADRLLDTSQPGLFNQAMMELGATVCLPRDPQCLLCPVRGHCEGFQANRQRELPVNLRAREPVLIEKTLLVIQRKEDLLLWQRAAESRRMAGFWELPERDMLPEVRMGEIAGTVKHTITHHRYTFLVVRARISGVPHGFSWFSRDSMAQLPLSTVTKKALRCLKDQPMP